MLTGSQLVLQSAGKALGLPCLALPEYDNPPSACFQRLSDLAIAGFVGTELGVPESPVRFHRVCELATRVSVPETAMNKDDSSMFGKDKVRRAWQLGDMQAESIAQSVQTASNNHFWGSVLGSVRFFNSLTALTISRQWLRRHSKQCYHPSLIGSSGNITERLAPAGRMTYCHAHVPPKQPRKTIQPRPTAAS